ncbi:TonB-dependent receptor [Echinicola marina]|uniref:SusC/RagA family TonB-linked outer membrane protein n=1 Tax=Echinicola marina TaxID=2859768 RepID=UPI001CF70C6E|nr:TonB-dependent receptor [Echinicola marina]UCS92111.1 TonB-dependent receptor [Echinicola marina]
MFNTITKQLLRKTKLLSLLLGLQLLSMQLSLANVVQGQNPKEISIEFEAKNASLESVFEQVEAMTDFVFLYDERIIESDLKFSLAKRQITVAELLDILAKTHPLKFQQLNNSISVKLEEGKTAVLDKILITGTIRDQAGQPLPGATVLVKGTNIGTVADLDGKFSLKADNNAILIFSMLGFSDQEISVNNRSTINMVLQEESASLDEVVVFGYSAVEKKHVASAVSDLDMERAVNRPLGKLQEVFSGTIPGVTMMQASNIPGGTPGSINIRGIATLQSASPLVIVDGMEQSLTDLDPNQIKSISVLKDAASASMYGSRGANGVIIIETKRGTTGKFKVDMHAWTAVNDPIMMPDFVNSADYMRLNNEARTIQGQSLLYTDEDIALSEQGELPNTNWLEEIMERKAHSYNVSSNISGGGGVGTFNLMLAYLKENGLNINEGSERFSARFNTNININDKFVLLADFYARRLQVDRLYANTNGHGLYTDAWRMNPTQAVFYDSDLPEHYALYDDRNPVASIHHGGLYNNLYDRSTINLRPKYHINDNLHLSGNVSYMINKSANKYKRETFKFYDEEGRPTTTWANAVGASQGVSVSQFTARGNINYESKLRKEKDKIYLIAGSEIMNHVYTDYREIAKASFYTKVNYSFDERYLLEVTARRDGSSKFAPGYRWGFFPSAAVAWNMHNESFFRDLNERGIVNNIKLRMSYGKVGNENVDPYLWQEDVNTWGWTMRVPNPSFTWENQTQSNIGLDVSLLKNRLMFTGELYNKLSTDLVYGNFPVPPLTGSYYLETSVNIGEVENKGWEVSANWSDKVGDFEYSIGGMLFDNKNKILKAGYNESDTLVFKGDIDKIWYNGSSINNYYGYESDGYFQTEEEINSTEAKLPNTLPGDIRYIDQNNDGIINENDRVYLGDPFPHMNYSVNMNLRFKNWDFSFLGQGVGKRLGRVNGLEGYPVIMDGNTNALGTPRQYYMDNRWTPETPNSRFPRVWTGTSPNANLSDIWLSDASYFRIKTLQLGYTIPKPIKGVQNLRMYINAQDAFTFTNWEGLEPEDNGGNGSYPRMATYSLGVKFTIL